jgi:hypothetical protein
MGAAAAKREERAWGGGGQSPACSRRFPRAPPVLIDRPSLVAPSLYLFGSHISLSHRFGDEKENVSGLGESDEKVVLVN